MRATIFNTIKDALESIKDSNNECVIKHIDLFNNQLTYIETEQPFNTPAVFIEFQPIEWSEQLHRVREAVVRVNLHVVTDSRIGSWSEAVSRLALCDTINANLQGIGAVDAAESVMNALTLISSTTDHDFDELQDNIETYSCHVTDRSAYK
ncbi:MAG: hypothetical protein MJ003_04825 [Paludibacteraceae bacterium]|nr:hypothetical protein [Paludibacteraceae bacterium]